MKDGNAVYANKGNYDLTYLERLNAPIFIADYDKKIVFGNDAFAKLVSRKRGQFEGIGIESLIHSEASGIERALATGDRTFVETWATINGNRYFLEYRPTPIFGAQGSITGIIEIIMDRTAQKQALQIVQDLIAKAKAGDLSSRADIKADGSYWEIAENVNDLLDALERPLGDLTACFKRMALNDLTMKMDQGYPGIWGELVDATNKVYDTMVGIHETIINISNGNTSDIDSFRKIGCKSENDNITPAFIKMLASLTGVIEEVAILTGAVTVGDFSKRGHEDEYQGGYREIILGMNGLIDSIADPLSEFISVLALVAVNDYTQKMTHAYSGVWDQLKNATNITLERIQCSEQQLRGQLNFLQALIDAVPAPIFFKDAGGVYRGCNNAFAVAVFGRNKPDIVGKDVFGVNPKEMADVFYRKDHELFENPGVQTYETKMRFAEGTDHDVIVHKATYEDGAGYLAGLVGVFIDITERKRMEKALQESEAMYRTIFENTGNATMILEDDATIALANQEFEKYSGYSKEEIEGKMRWMEFLAPAAQEESKGLCCLVADNSATASKQYELQVIDKNGETRDILTTVASIPGTRRSVLSFVDITEHKQLEERLRQLNFHDTLTGLYNRAFFEVELQRLDSNRQLPLSIILGDINGLKLINDTLGHQKGDELLVRAAAILRRSGRSEDIVCRWAGDEFAIILPQTDLAIASQICNRISKACHETERDLLALSFSLGAATKEHAGQSIEGVFEDAEDLMYRDKLRDSRSTRFSVINFFQRALVEKSAETLGHTRRIQGIVTRIGNELGLSRKEKDELGILAAMHDIGQIAIPSELLTKPCYLTAEEWDVIRRHPEIGETIARSVPDLVPVADAILSHHEFWNGTGYPRRLQGTQIPLYSRILAIADAYDVMTNGRPYKKAISHEEALEEIRKCNGTQFDPALVTLFVATFTSREP